MHEISLLLMNFKETRRRSIKVWEAIPIEKLDWKPDAEALSCHEMIRHVLEGEYGYYQILRNGGSATLTDEVNPYDTRDFTTVDEELNFAEPYREEFLNYIKTLNADDLENIKIDRTDVGYIRSLGDMFMRIAYHEAVHTGQLLDYLRTMNADRPQIWD